MSSEKSGSIIKPSRRRQLSPICNRFDMNTSLYFRSIRPVRITTIAHRMACKRGFFLGGLVLVLIGFGEIRGRCADSSVAQNAGTSGSSPQSTNAPSPVAVGPLLDLFVKKG